MRPKRGITALILFFIIYQVSVAIYTAQGQDDESWPPGEKSLSLEECIRLAARNSFEIKLARLDFLIAETDQGVAESIYDAVLSLDINYENDKRATASTLAGDQTKTNIYSIGVSKDLPSGTELDLTFSDERKWTNSPFVTNNPTHTSEVTLEARQPLGKNFFGYIDRRSISVTSLAVENSDLDTKERIESMLAEVEKAYWQWSFAKKSLGIHRKILEKAKDLHRANEKNYDIGRIEKGDALASGANVLIREKDVAIIENQYRSAEEKIKLLMNIEASGRFYPEEDLRYKAAKISLEDCLTQAFQNRRDYHKARRDVKIKDLALETKDNERWPEIDLVASFAANGIDGEFGRAFNNMSSDGNSDYYAGIEISIPLENNLAQSEFEKAQHNKEKVLLSLKQTERTIVTEIGNAFRNYITYQTNFVNLKKAAQLQYEKLNAEEKRFKYGRSSTKRLIDYQQDYLDAELELVQGLLELELARVNLEKTINLILEKYARLL